MDRKVRVRYSGLVRNVVGKNEEEVQVPGDLTVRQLLQLLIERHGNSFRDSLLAVGGQLLPNALVLVSGRDVAEIGGLDAEVGRDKDISIAVVVNSIIGG